MQSSDEERNGFVFRRRLLVWFVFVLVFSVRCALACLPALPLLSFCRNPETLKHCLPAFLGSSLIALPSNFFLRGLNELRAFLGVILTWWSKIHSHRDEVTNERRRAPRWFEVRQPTSHHRLPTSSIARTDFGSSSNNNNNKNSKHRGMPATKR